MDRNKCFTMIMWIIGLLAFALTACAEPVDNDGATTKTTEPTRTAISESPDESSGTQPHPIQATNREQIPDVPTITAAELLKNCAQDIDLCKRERVWVIAPGMDTSSSGQGPGPDGKLRWTRSFLTGVYGSKSDLLGKNENTDVELQCWFEPGFRQIFPHDLHPQSSRYGLRPDRDFSSAVSRFNGRLGNFLYLQRTTPVTFSGVVYDWRTNRYEGVTHLRIDDCRVENWGKEMEEFFRILYEIVEEREEQRKEGEARRKMDAATRDAEDTRAREEVFEADMEVIRQQR